MTPATCLQSMTLSSLCIWSSCLASKELQSVAFISSLFLSPTKYYVLRLLSLVNTSLSEYCPHWTYTLSSHQRSVLHILPVAVIPSPKIPLERPKPLPEQTPRVLQHVEPRQNNEECALLRSSPTYIPTKPESKR